MRPALIAICLATVLCGFVLPAVAADEPAPAAPAPAVAAPAAPAQTVVVTTAAAPREVRDYKVDVAIKGKMPDPDTGQTVDLDVSLALKIRHTYGRREGDGLLPLEITLTNGQITAAGQTLQITPSLYPKLTVLLDRDWRIDDVYGASARYTRGFPGINYGNMIMLFYLQGADKPRAVGEAWESKLKLLSLGETYSFTNTLKGVKEVGGVKAAVARQQIVRAPSQTATGFEAALKAVAESSFALENGRLLASHVEGEATFTKKPGSTTQQEPAPLSTNIRIDISQISSLDSQIP